MPLMPGNKPTNGKAMLSWKNFIELTIQGKQQLVEFATSPVQATLFKLAEAIMEGMAKDALQESSEPANAVLQYRGAKKLVEQLAKAIEKASSDQGSRLVSSAQGNGKPIDLRK